MTEVYSRIHPQAHDIHLYICKIIFFTVVYDGMRYCEAVDMMVDYSIVEVVEEIKGDAAYAVDGAVSKSIVH